MRKNSYVFLICWYLVYFNKQLKNLFCFQANISNEEYDRMYRVYQKSVRQTELLRDLRESVERDDKELMIAETKKMHLSPSGNLHF